MLLHKRKVEGAPEVDDGSDKIFVFFPDTDKLNEAAVKSMAATMLENNVFNSIIIVKGTTQVGRKVRDSSNHTSSLC